MEEEMEMKAEQPGAILGLLLAPLAVLLALATTRVVGIEYDLTLNNMMPMLVVAIASMLALVPRIVLATRPDLSMTTVSLGVLVLALPTEPKPKRSLKRRSNPTVSCFWKHFCREKRRVCWWSWTEQLFGRCLRAKTISALTTVTRDPTRVAWVPIVQRPWCHLRFTKRSSSASLNRCTSTSLVRKSPIVAFSSSV